MTPTANRTRLFVYGTLKRGYCRHPALAGQTFLGEGRTLPQYRMVNVGTYPGLLDAPDQGLAILGELWEVTPEALRRLDEVEGTDVGLFARRRIRLEVPFENESADAYFYLRDTTGCPDCGQEWNDPATRIG